MGTDLTATMTGEARAGFLGAAVAPSGVTISLRPPRRSRCMGTRMVGVSSCGPVCSITVTDRLAMQIGLSLVFAALAGLGGAVLTVAQLGIFKEGITAGRGWIAVALVIFARWRPGLALAGALLFGCATALQFRLQALNLPWLPYEVLLMLPYLLTLLVLLRVRAESKAPAALGTPYVKE